MRCIECYCLSRNTACGSDKVCCNKESENYNKVSTQEETEVEGCDSGESEQAVDHRRLNVWGFASKYYM